MNIYENFSPPTQNDQNNLLAECKGKMLELVEKFGKLDEVHKEEFYDWACKNIGVSLIEELLNQRNTFSVLANKY